MRSLLRAHERRSHACLRGVHGGARLGTQGRSELAYAEVVLGADGVDVGPHQAPLQRLQRGDHLRHVPVEVLRVAAVRLGQHDHEPAARAVHGAPDLEVAALEAHRGVHEADDPPEVLGPPEVGVHELRPLLPQGPRDLGVAVAGQVHEGEPPAHVEDEEVARAARLLGGPGDLPAVDERVDEARLPDVGPPDHADLRDPGLREPVHRREHDDRMRRDGRPEDLLSALPLRRRPPWRRDGGWPKHVHPGACEPC
mmetsp:Transcript_24444/g.70132  ORF Transcript_24444/g.70132 Transcript_24444/m.70132 type:complete len:254 (+) Transcript_24444:155-916(+)